MRRLLHGLILSVALFSFFASRVQAEPPQLHTQVLVFIPAYEGSMLYDPDLAAKGGSAPCVWGSVDAIRTSDLYFALRMPNPLVARPMLSAGPIDVYGRFVDGVTDDHDSAPGFHPYTQGADFFTFAYDWRQEIASVTAPQLEQALLDYARIHEGKTGIPAEQTRFVIVAHSMGGLVARTLISEKPEWADRISRLYLVGTPNLGSVKAIKTLVLGPGGLKENVTVFPASLLNLLPNTVDVNVTKLVAITRPSLYELLPFDDPRWECVAADGSRTRVGAPDVLSVGPWEPYWPTAELEKRLFLDGWLKRQQSAGRKSGGGSDWAFCQDADLHQLQKILAQVKDWRLRMGSLSYTNTLLTRPGEASRLKIVLGTGLKTPTGIITEGAHDFCTARFTYAPDYDGDETVTGASVLDDLHPAPANLQLLTRVPHGKLVTDPQFLDYIYGELSNEPVMPPRSKPDEISAPESSLRRLAPGSSIP
jgi:pimeloyl-ACP methyl ester carboxylesterase